MFNILVAEDDRNLRTLICDYLSQSGYRVFAAADGRQALDIMESQYVDLLICDIMMPNVDGYSLVKSLRLNKYSLPILMITAKETIDDKEKGFSSGTDDYMVKPIILKELNLRVAALLRRSKITHERQIRLDGCIVDYDTMSVSFGTETAVLPQKEFLLLFKLLSSPGRIFTRQQLLDEIWGMDSESVDRTVDVHINRLRDKLDKYGCFKIVTVRGLGYKAER